MQSYKKTKLFLIFASIILIALIVLIGFQLVEIKTKNDKIHNLNQQTEIMEKKLDYLNNHESESSIIDNKFVENN